MENYKGMMKVKRKELEEVNDDFSDFSLSSPARKIRRLDIELPPIVEEEETDHSMGYEQIIPETAMSNSVGNPVEVPDIEDLPSVSANEEKAIVLFKPINSSNSYSVTNFTVDPNLISGFKNQGLWGVNIYKNDNDVTDGDDRGPNSCRAVIPWVPSQQFKLKPELLDSNPEVPESMDAEDPDVTTMDIEDAGAADVGQQPSEFYNIARSNESLPHGPHPWQQQHCMFPQPPQNTGTPVVWYR